MTRKRLVDFLVVNGIAKGKADKLRGFRACSSGPSQPYVQRLSQALSMQMARTNDAVVGTSAR